MKVPFITDICRYRIIDHSVRAGAVKGFCLNVQRTGITADRQFDRTTRGFARSFILCPTELHCQFRSGRSGFISFFNRNSGIQLDKVHRRRNRPVEITVAGIFCTDAVPCIGSHHQARDNIILPGLFDLIKIAVCELLRIRRDIQRTGLRTRGNFNRSQRHSAVRMRFTRMNCERHIHHTRSCFRHIGNTRGRIRFLEEHSGTGGRQEEPVAAVFSLDAVSGLVIQQHVPDHHRTGRRIIGAPRGLAAQRLRTEIQRAGAAAHSELDRPGRRPAIRVRGIPGQLRIEAGVPFCRAISVFADGKRCRDRLEDHNKTFRRIKDRVSAVARLDTVSRRTGKDDVFKHPRKAAVGTFRHADPGIRAFTAEITRRQVIFTGVTADSERDRPRWTLGAGQSRTPGKACFHGSAIRSGLIHVVFHENQECIDLEEIDRWRRRTIEEGVVTGINGIDCRARVLPHFQICDFIKIIIRVIIHRTAAVREFRV